MHKTLIILIASIVLISCSSNKQIDITGIWTSVGFESPEGITDEVIFNADGSHELKLLTKDGKVNQSLNGTYMLDLENSTIEITTLGQTFKHKIVNITSEEIEVITQDGINWRMKRK